MTEKEFRPIIDRMIQVLVTLSKIEESERDRFLKVQCSNHKTIQRLLEHRTLSILTEAQQLELSLLKIIFQRIEDDYLKEHPDTDPNEFITSGY